MKQLNNNYTKEKVNKTWNFSYLKIKKKNITSLMNTINNSIIEYSNYKLIGKNIEIR